jgi:PLP dependent protein
MPIAENIRSITAEIEAYCRTGNRDPASVLLLAVSKTKPPEAIAAAYRAGLRHFGENYCQEAIEKQQALSAYDITWHFIGPIQSNKTKLIAKHFSWVHSVNNHRIARRLSEQRPPHLPPLNICLQVNISGETSKSGLYLPELEEVWREIETLPNIKLRGVMAIPAPQADFASQRQPYHCLVQAAHQLNRPELDTYSFGMSDDLKAAIVEGATIVRIGTALFGARK